jgi:hypothetical protein
MTGYATRVSTFATGDTIAAADSNDEFDALITAFGTTGHTHDGTAGNGGNLAALRSHAITLGLGTAGTDVVVTFDGETNDGVLTWMEDEDHFKFTDDVLLNGTEKLLFNDTGTYIHSNADGDLDIVSDGTEVDSINLESAGGITLDAGTAASGIIYEDDGTEMLRVHNSSSDVILESKVSDKDIIFKGNDNGAVITALTLNMSDGGTAQFNDKIQCNSINTGSSAGTLTMFGGGTNKGGTIEMSGGNNTGSTGSGIVFKTGASTSSPSEKMRIDQTGAVTMPLQPAFSVHKGGTAQSDITANDAFYTITWSGERFDQNADFSSNTFTAPVTGKYFFQLNVRLQQVDTAGGYYILGISTSNEDYRFIFDPDFTADPNYWGISMSVLADMDANDTVTTSILQQTGTAQTDIGGSPEYTFFTGFLAC